MNYFNGEIFGDCLILQTILEELNFGTETYNIDFGIKIQKGDEFLFSEVVFKYPELYIVFTEFRKLYFSDFYFTNVMINYNTEEDNIKREEIVSVGIGDYRGGNLVLLDDEKKRSLHRSWNNPVRFNSDETEYYFTNFTGDRYNLIFYTFKII